jgi:hypothetical protein
MKVSTVSVIGGWQTELVFADGSTVRVGPVCNDCKDTWNWQRVNMFNVTNNYALREAA